MSDDVFVTYDLTLDDLIYWNEHHMANSPTYRRSRFIQTWVITLSVFAGIGAVAVLTRDAGLAIFGTVVMSLYLLYVMRHFRKAPAALARKFYAEGQNKSTLGKHTIRLTNDGIFETCEVGEQKIYWSGIERVTESPGYAFIYLGAVQAYVIPEKRVVAGDFRTFIDEVRRRMG